MIGSGTPLAIQGADEARRTIDGTVLAGESVLERDDVYAIQTYAPQPSPARMRAAPQRYREGDIGADPRRPAGPHGQRHEQLLPRGDDLGPTLGRARRHRGRGGDAFLRLRRRLRARDHAHDRRADGLRRRAGGRATPPDELRLQPQRRPRDLPAGDLPARRAVGLLPALRRLDGVDAAHGRDPGAGGVRLRPWPLRVQSRGIRGPRHRRARLGRGLLPRHRLGHLRPDAVGGARRGADARGGWRSGAAARRLPSRTPSAATCAASRRRSPAARSARWTIPAASGDLCESPGSGSPGSSPCSPRSRSRPGAAGSPRRRPQSCRHASSREALDRLGWTVDRPATLFRIERHFKGAGRPVIAGYAEALRRHRYGASVAPRPGARERRRLRATLAAGGGLRRRLRAMRAVPPEAPARRRLSGSSGADDSAPALAGLLEASLYHDSGRAEGDRALLRRRPRVAGGRPLARRDRVPRRRVRAPALRPRWARRARRSDRRARHVRPRARLPAHRRQRIRALAARGSPRSGSRSRTSTSGARADARSTSRTPPGTCSRSPTATSGGKGQQT